MTYKSIHHTSEQTSKYNVPISADQLSGNLTGSSGGTPVAHNMNKPSAIEDSIPSRNTMLVDNDGVIDSTLVKDASCGATPSYNDGYSAF